MKYLLDTCVISELVKPSPNLSVTAWIAATPSDDVFLSVITIGEIRKGIVKLPESKKKTRLTQWLTTLLEEYTDRILSIDVAVSKRWGTMQAQAEHAGTPLSTLDGLIAATAAVYNLTIATRNESDFSASHCPLMNPWSLHEKGESVEQKKEDNA